jgi:hypothetical protein
MIFDQAKATFENVISLGGAEFSLQSLGGVPPVSEALLPV